MMKVYYIVLHILLFSGCICIDLRLPEDLKNEKDFEVEELYIDYPYAAQQFGVTYYSRSIVSKRSEHITRVFLNGHQVFNDTERITKKLNRIVGYTTLKGRSLLSVMILDHRRHRELVLYFANGNAYNILNIQKLLTGELHRICGLTPGEFVAKTFYKFPPTPSPDPQQSLSQAMASLEISESFATEEDISLDINNIFERHILSKFGLYSDPHYRP